MRNRSMFWGVLMLLGAGAGCDDGTTPPDGVGGEGGEGGSAAGGSGGSGAGTVEGGPASCDELGGPNADAKYPGIDNAKFAATDAVMGCDKGFDAGADAFTLTLSGATRISFGEGQMFANGNKCTDSAGADVVLGGSTSITINGTSGDDLLLLDFATEKHAGLHIDLLDGEDTVFVKGTEARDVYDAARTMGILALDLDGDVSTDAALGNMELLVVSLGDGDDRFDASPMRAPAMTESVVVCGGGGNDDLRGGAGLDTLEGGEGDDILRSSKESDGADLFDGGPGFDTVDYAERTESVSVSLDDEQNDGEDGEVDNVRGNIEAIVGGAGNDTLIGSDKDERFEGGAGDDTIDPGMGDDRVNGGAGDDAFLASADLDGDDVLNGGEGNDSISYADRAIGIQVSLCVAETNVGCDEGCTCLADDGEAGEKDNLVNVEGVFGTDQADVMKGDANANQLFGNGGDDDLDGGSGDDSLFGDLGIDTLEGGEGDDYLDGGDGADFLRGGGGSGDICVIDGNESAPQCELY